MDIFYVLTLVGGLSLFLFGMNIMGQCQRQIEIVRKRQSNIVVF